MGGKGHTSQADAKAHEHRVAEMQARKADIWLPGDVLKKINALVAGAHKNYKEADPSILLVTAARVAALHKLLAAPKNAADGANLHLSELDMVELRQISYYAERFHDDFGSLDDLGLSTKEIPALTEKLRQYCQAAFPG